MLSTLSSEVDSVMLWFTQTSKTTPIYYAEGLQNEIPSFDLVYEKFVFEQLFIEGLHDYILQNMCSYRMCNSKRLNAFQMHGH